jgi:hypothetical protein
VSLGLAQFVVLLGMPWLTGVLLLRALDVRPRGVDVGFAGQALAIGLLATAAVTFAAAWLGLPLGARGAQLGLLAVAAAAMWATLRRRRPRRPGPAPAAAGTRAGRAAFAVCVAVSATLVVVRALAAAGQLVVEHDESVIYAAKAKALFATGGLGEAFAAATAGVQPYEHFDYPLLNPSLQLWTFLHAGAITHFENRWPLQAAMLALVLVAAGALRRVARPAVAGGVLLLLVWGRETRALGMQAMADHLVALGFLLALDAWTRWSQTRDVRWWRLCCVGLAFLAWAKNEGAMLVLCVAAAASFDPGARALWPRRRELLWLALPAALLAAHAATNARFGFHNDLLAHDLGGQAVAAAGERLPVVAGFFGRVLAWPDWTVTNGLLLAGAWFAVLAPRAALRAPFRTVALAAALGLLGYLVVFLGTHQPLLWHLSTAASRLVFHVLPAAALFAAACCEAALAGDREAA